MTCSTYVRVSRIYVRRRIFWNKNADSSTDCVTSVSREYVRTSSRGCEQEREKIVCKEGLTYMYSCITNFVFDTIKRMSTQNYTLSRIRVDKSTRERILKI